MRKNAILMLVLSLVIPGFTACDDSGNEIPDVDVVFQNAVQTGGTSGTADSTALVLTFDVDPETMTADNITVTGATKGALTGSDTTRTLTISGITVADGETVSVTITSPVGYSITGSPQTAVVYRELYIGMPFQGGIIAYIYQTGETFYVDGETHGLIAAIDDQSIGIVWISGGSTQTTSVPGYTEFSTGSENTDYIIAQAVAANNNIPTSYAAGLARSYNGGSYTDWYLPTINELIKMYNNRVAIGGFDDDYYWSSSEYNDYEHAFCKDFGSEFEYLIKKNETYRVRAVRQF